MNISQSSDYYYVLLLSSTFIYNTMNEGRKYNQVNFNIWNDDQHQIDLEVNEMKICTGFFLYLSYQSICIPVLHFKLFNLCIKIS
jgi:hypothetical protein